MSPKDALEECSGIFGSLKLLSLVQPIDGREQKPVTGGLSQVSMVVIDQLNITGGKKAKSYSCCVRACIAKLFTPGLEDFKKTVGNIPVSGDRSSVLKRYGDNVAGFCKETRYHLIWKHFLFLSIFHRWVLTWDNPHRWLLLRHTVVLEYRGPMCMSGPKLDLGRLSTKTLNAKSASFGVHEKSKI